MKIRSLLLGSVAAAGLSTGAYAADLGVLTSLDVCDALGISGLTIASSSNCLSITGGVAYELTWGDYGADTAVFFNDVGPWNGFVATDMGGYDDKGDTNVITPNGQAPDELDWDSKVEAWLKVVAAAASDFGTAKAVIGFRQFQHTRVRNEETIYDAMNVYSLTSYGDNLPLEMEEAYVSIGDTTIIMAGLRRSGINGSIANIDDDAAFTVVQPFLSSVITGSGVMIEGGKDDLRFGGASIQIVSDLGNGFSVGAALENIDNTPYAIPPGTFGTGPFVPANDADMAGTALGVISYKGDGVTAHATGGAFGVLDGDVNGYFLHAGATGSVDIFKIRGAFGFEHDVVSTNSVWQALVSAEAAFDIFTLAAAFEYADTDRPGYDEAYGVALSGKFAVTDSVAINLAGRWGHNENHAAGAEDTLHLAAQLVASVTESIKLTGEVGGYFNAGGFPASTGSATDTIYYGSLEGAWAPGGGFTASLKGEVNSLSAYRATFKAAKSFQ